MKSFRGYLLESVGPIDSKAMVKWHEAQANKHYDNAKAARSKEKSGYSETGHYHDNLINAHNDAARAYREIAAAHKKLGKNNG